MPRKLLQIHDYLPAPRFVRPGEPFQIIRFHPPSPHRGHWAGHKIGSHREGARNGTLDISPPLRSESRPGSQLPWLPWLGNGQMPFRSTYRAGPVPGRVGTTDRSLFGGLVSAW